MAQDNTVMDVRRINDKTSVIDVHGAITNASESTLMDAYTQANSDNTKAVIINFSGLDYMNSSGIGLLVTLLVRANRQRQQILAYGLNEHYQHIFELTRLNEAIGIHSSEADALSAAGSH